MCETPYYVDCGRPTTIGKGGWHALYHHALMDIMAMYGMKLACSTCTCASVLVFATLMQLLSVFLLSIEQSYQCSCQGAIG